jgi:hypothetical protein
MAEFEPIVGRYLPVSCDGLGYRIFVEETGDGVPLLCLHTAGADSRQYRHVLNDTEVASRFRVGSSRSIFPGTADPTRQLSGG